MRQLIAGRGLVDCRRNNDVSEIAAMIGDGSTPAITYVEIDGPDLIDDPILWTSF